MICKNKKTEQKKTGYSFHPTLLVIYRSGFWVYLIDLRHAFQKLSEERPQAHIHLQTTKKVDFFFLWSTTSANLSPSSGAMKQRRGIFLQVNTYLVNDILEENGEGQCRVLQLV